MTPSSAEVRQGLEAGSTVEAAAEAQRRLAALEVLSGTTPVTGPGVRVTLSDAPGSTSAVDASTVLDAVQELRDAGAQAIQVGPVVALANPAEYFCQFGLDMRAKSRFPVTFIVELANDCVGYVPTEDALGPRGGGYETRLTSYSNLVPSAGRTICDALKGLAAGMKPGPVPAAAQAPPFQGQPWSYGNLPPELD